MRKFLFTALLAALALAGTAKAEVTNLPGGLGFGDSSASTYGYLTRVAYLY